MTPLFQLLTVLVTAVCIILAVVDNPIGTEFTGLELVTLVLSVYLPFHVNATDTKNE